jgi:hypothetical protein
MEVRMKKALVLVLIFGWFSLLSLPLTAVAGPFDQLKNLKIDPKAIMQPKQNAVAFQFTNFKLNPDSSDPSRIWNVDLKITQAIAANTYLVKAVFQNRAGETLFSGEDIPLPAGSVGKNYSLTRPFQKQPPASRMIFQVYNQAEGRIVASQTYPLAAVSSYGIQGAATSASAKPAVPQRVSESSSANLTANPDVAFLFSPLRGRVSTQQFQIQNKSSFVVRIDAISAKSKFLIGVDQNIDVNCDSREVQPGQSIGCSYDCPSVDCPTLAMIAVEARLNGNTHHGELKVDAPIKAIRVNPIVTLTKTNGFSNSTLINGGGTAEVIVRGSYVKPGGDVTMRGLASVDSDRFPVTFIGVQEDGGIVGYCQVMGAKLNVKPDNFCFYLTEIRTCDAMTCGGAGLLLWENDFSGDGINKFIIHKQCK